MFEEYEYVIKQSITNEKADKFLSKNYYKIFHLLSSEILYKELLVPHNIFKLDSKQCYEGRILGKPMGWYLSWKQYSCPLVLPLHCCKGFVHTNIANGSLGKRYPECTFNEFDYIPVSKEEAIIAYGLNIPLSYYKKILKNE
jgi:hypothetical protein